MIYIVKYRGVLCLVTYLNSVHALPLIYVAYMYCMFGFQPSCQFLNTQVLQCYFYLMVLRKLSYLIGVDKT